jgi:hypothetical protein
MTTQPNVIRMHHEHFRQLQTGDEWAFAVDLGLAIGEKVIATPFTKDSHGEADANMEVIAHPAGPGNGTALRVTSIISPKRMGGKRWANANELLTIERDGSAH